MDNVGCYGPEAKLTHCAYHTDTSEDSHSRDVWIDCRNTESNYSSTGGSDDAVPVTTSEKTSDVALIVALVGLIFSILVSIALAAYIIYTKQHGLCKNTG